MLTSSLKLASVLILLIVSLGSPQPAPGAEEGWYDASWHYRRALTLSNPNTAGLTNQQVLVTLDSSFDFWKARSDGGDMRILDEDGVTLLPFWIENWNPAVRQARVWVKVPAIPGGGTRGLYLYYGNAAASSISNGSNNFEFFDDFNASSVPALGYFSLSSAQTVLTQSGWEVTAPHNLSVVQAPVGPYSYWGYYGLFDCSVSSSGIGRVRSNDLVNWVKDPTPLISWDGSRWPSVIRDSTGIYYMVHTRRYCDGKGFAHIVLRTSTDGINFGGQSDYIDLVPPETNGLNQNPNLFKDPITNQYYLYWMFNGGIKYKSAATPVGLALAEAHVLLDHGVSDLISGPNMLYYNNTYYLSTETQDGGSWKTYVYTSSSPTGPFQLLPDSPQLTDGSACLFQHIFQTTLHEYYCKLNGSIWTVDYRTADLTSGRKQVQVLDPVKWPATGGAWTVTTAILPNAASGNVAQAATVRAQQVSSSIYSGGDFVLEAYGKQVSGHAWGLGLRMIDSNHFYSVVLYEDLDATNNLYVYNWHDGWPTTVANTAVGVINANSWYKLTVKAHGSSLDVYLNDVQRLQATDTQYGAGSVAMYGEEGTIAQFKNVLVRKYAAIEPVVSIGLEETNYLIFRLPIIERSHAY